MHQRVPFDIGGIPVPQIAEQLVGGTLGKNDDIARHAAAGREVLEAADERKHDNNDAHLKREGCQQHGGDRPANDDIAGVVAGKQLTYPAKAGNQNRDRRQKRSKDGQHGKSWMQVEWPRKVFRKYGKTLRKHGCCMRIN